MNGRKKDKKQIDKKPFSRSSKKISGAFLFHFYLETSTLIKTHNSKKTNRGADASVGQRAGFREIGRKV